MNIRFCRLALVALIASFAMSSARAQTVEAPKPLVTRIFMTTIGAPEVSKVEQWYTTYLGFKVRRRGNVAVGMAESWGTPKSAGRPFILMSSDGSPEVFIRVVETDAVNDYKAMTTLGWNAFEIIVDDLDKLSDTLKQSPFKIIGQPRSLGGGFASIHAMQVIGPAEEVLYLTTEKGNRETSSLPIPKAQVDRPFIVVLAGPSVPAMRDFYADTLKMQTLPNFDGPLTLAARAMKLPEKQVFPLTLVRAAERGNSIELDGYPASAKARPRAPGQLPPGNAMATFNIHSFEGLKAPLMTRPSNNYGPRRSAAFIGPAGEITELIDDPQP